MGVAECFFHWTSNLFFTILELHSNPRPLARLAQCYRRLTGVLQRMQTLNDITTPNHELFHAKKVQHHHWNIINPQMNQPTSQNHPSKLHCYQATERPSRAATVDPHVSQVGERRLCNEFFFGDFTESPGGPQGFGQVSWVSRDMKTPCLGRSSPGWDARLQNATPSGQNLPPIHRTSGFHESL